MEVYHASEGRPNWDMTAGGTVGYWGDYARRVVSGSLFRPMDTHRSEQLAEFVAYTKTLDGDEKGEAQVFIDRLFKAFSRRGYKEAGAKLEMRVKNDRGGTAFADLVWKPRVLIEMKRRLVCYFFENTTLGCRFLRNTDSLSGKTLAPSQVPVGAAPEVGKLVVQAGQ